jgi:hypothetical protein
VTDAGGPRRAFRPELNLLLPESWVARASVELIEPEIDAHVLITFDDLGEHGTLDDYVEGYGSVLESRTPNYEEVRRESVELTAGRAAIVRQFRWQPDGGAPVEQLQVYLVDGQRGVAATLSTPRPLAEVEPAFVDLLRGITTAAPPVGGLARLADDPRSRTFDALERGDLAAAPRRGNGGVPEAGRWQDARTAWEARAEGGHKP